ncbi:FaeA/PapI family transcriptional regulator [Hafnia sp.]|uniref:FaeA/PapI family transcriptional regulator n=1 Tax=Hafnia sp. TaxID=1873498 RepID=UPI002FCAE902
MMAYNSISQQLWRYLNQQDVPCSTAEIGHHFDLSTYQALHYLQMLYREGKVIRLSSGRGRAALWQNIKKA